MNAIFLGSFNPPHIGHLNVIQSVLDSVYGRYIDKIHIIPCRQNPNKNKFQVSYVTRYKMCEALFKELIDKGKVVINDIENEILPEYSYNLLKYIEINKCIGNNFKWIITEETLEEIIDSKWNNSVNILKEFGSRMIVLSDNDSKYEDLSYISLNPGINVHSTDIRNLVKNKKSIKLYTNQEVVNIIEEKNLYK